MVGDYNIHGLTDHVTGPLSLYTPYVDDSPGADVTVPDYTCPGAFPILDRTQRGDDTFDWDSTVSVGDVTVIGAGYSTYGDPANPLPDYVAQGATHALVRLDMSYSVDGGGAVTFPVATEGESPDRGYYAAGGWVNCPPDYVTAFVASNTATFSSGAIPVPVDVKSRTIADTTDAGQLYLAPPTALYTADPDNPLAACLWPIEDVAGLSVTRSLSLTAGVFNGVGIFIYVRPYRPVRGPNTGSYDGNPDALPVPQNFMAVL